jgi:hypothetical protein
MYREKHITQNYDFTKPQLVELRKSPQYKEGQDWFRVQSLRGLGAVEWTEDGLKKLLDAKGIKAKVDLNKNVEVSQDVRGEEVIQEVAEKPVPGIVKTKFANKRMIVCEVRGEKVNVLVKDSKFLRVNSIITVSKRGDKFIGSFKVDGRGRIHA